LAPRRLPFLSDAASDVRRAVARARARRNHARRTGPAEASATAELSRRLDETRERLKREHPPRAD
jgi:hypothetical protein